MKFFNSKIDLIVSDMASNTTGNKSLDCIRTNQLCLDVLEFSKDRLNKKGVVVSKLFMGEEFEQIKNRSKKYFKKIDFSVFFKNSCGRRNKLLILILS